MDDFAAEVMKPARKPEAYAKVWADGVDDIWGLDLADMGDVASDNDGYRYILVVVDVFSRYAWCVPVKTKDAKASWDAFARVLREHKPSKIWVDQGAEFYNKVWDSKLKALDIHRYSTYGGAYKVSIAERFIKTLKHKIWYDFVRDNTRKWIDKLDEYVEEYNETKHSALGMSPSAAREPDNERKLLDTIPKPVYERPKYKLNQWVRIHRKKELFERGFHPSFSYEMFKIIEIRMSHPVRYYLSDFYGEKIEGAWYESELTPVNQPTFFPVEKVLQRRTVKGKKEVLAKLLGYTKPVWMPASAVSDL